MKYEEYKDSGMSWVGDVPINWQRKRIKFLCSNSSAGIWGEEKKGDVNDIVCFRIADFDYQRGYLCFDKLTFRNIQSKDLNGRTLTENSLLIEKSGGGEVTPVGRVVRYNYGDKATCSNFIHFITINKLYNRDFLYYYFYALYANKENLLYFNQTTGIQNLKIGEYLGQSIFLPSFTEQQAIATYLNEKCGEINREIDVQKKKIDLLGELKQTIITNAVTKGLNPNIPMKDSGVEWIGKIPAHWEVRKIKYICQSEKFSVKTGPFGSQLKGQDLQPEGDVCVYNQRNVIDGQFEETQFFVSNNKAKTLTSFYTKPLDLLVTSRGTIGKCAILPKDRPIGILHPCLIALRINQHICDLIWAKIFINDSVCFATNIFLNSNSTTIEVIYTDTLKNIVIPIPPIQEQQKIITHIENETGKIDSQISKANRRIELLEELKQSIITEAVTGKIKVC